MVLKFTLQLHVTRFCLKWHLWKFSVSGGVEFLQWTSSRRTINRSIEWDPAAVPHLARFWREQEYSVSCHSCRIWCDNRKCTHYYVRVFKNQFYLYFHAKPIKCSGKNHTMKPNYHWICPLICWIFHPIKGHRTKRCGIHRCDSFTSRPPLYLLLNQQCFIPLPHKRRPDRAQKSEQIIFPQEDADERTWKLRPCTHTQWHLLRKTQK